MLTVGVEKLRTVSGLQYLSKTSEALERSWVASLPQEALMAVEILRSTAREVAVLEQTHCWSSVSPSLHSE